VIERRIAIRTLLVAALAAGCSPASHSATVEPSTGSSAAASPTASPTAASLAIAASPSPALPVEIDIESAGATAIAATPSGDWAVVVDGRPWIAGLGNGIGVLDETGKLRGTHCHAALLVHREREDH